MSVLDVMRSRRDDVYSGRLVCFPCAGGSASLYRSWLDSLPDDLQPVGIELPGHGRRLRHPLATDMPTIAAEAAGALLGLDDLPLALFGHSMGAVVAFEVTRLLEQADRPPTILFASSALPPSWLGRSQLHLLPDPEFLAELSKMDGIPQEALAHRELMDVMLPILRADITLLERKPATDHRIATPIVAMGGQDDPHLPANYREGWGTHTTSSFDSWVFPGTHFYLTSHADLVAGDVGRRALDSFGDASL